VELEFCSISQISSQLDILGLDFSSKKGQKAKQLDFQALAEQL
jgi:hypothetical protein